MFLLIPTSAERAVYGMPWFTMGTVGVCTLSWVASFYVDVFGPLGYVPAEGLGLTLVLYAFAHGGFMHLFGNMIFLWCMGVNLETRWGTPTYAAVYLSGAAVSGLSYGLLHAGSTIPLVGASGAIATLMGCFLVSLFKTRINFWYLLFFFFRVKTGTFKVPAYVVLPLWFLSDLFGAYVEAHGAGGGVAYSAHVGGFVLGVGVAGALKLSGYEDKLIEQTGSDVHEDPSAWTSLPPEQINPVQRFAVKASEPPVPQPALAGAASKAEPVRCGGCGLVNMPGASDCRRCGAAL